MNKKEITGAVLLAGGVFAAGALGRPSIENALSRLSVKATSTEMPNSINIDPLQTATPLLPLVPEMVLPEVVVSSNEFIDTPTPTQEMVCPTVECVLPTATPTKTPEMICPTVECVLPTATKTPTPVCPTVVYECNTPTPTTTPTPKCGIDCIPEVYPIYTTDTPTPTPTVEQYIPYIPYNPEPYIPYNPEPYNPEPSIPEPPITY